MKRTINYLLLLIFCISGISCTSARWTVKEKSAVDPDDYNVLSSTEFLSTSSTISPENPNLELQVLSNTRYEYAEKILVQRTIQDYKLKPGFLALGIIGAGLAAYAANSKAIIGGQSAAASLSLNAAAVIIAGAGLMNMKPEGEPRQTGEERFLRKTGTVIQQDTLQIDNPANDVATISIWYGDTKLIDQENRNLQNGDLNINLGGLLDGLGIQGMNPDEVKLEIQYADSSYHYEYPLNHVLQPFARITSPIAELRSTPEQSPENILAELIEGSQLQIVDSIQSEWYKVLYGISENYISRKNADLIWRSSDFSRKNEVVAVPIVPFGNIDVESNIPILTGVNSNAVGLVITNENYTKPYGVRSYAHRDGQLIQAYMENALGLQAESIFRIKDLSSPDSLLITLKNIERVSNDSTQVYVYLNGYGSVTDEGDTHTLYFESTGENTESINLLELFEEISSLTEDKLIVLADIEFNPLSNEPVIAESEVDLKQPLRRISQTMIDDNSEATVIFSSEINQDSELYVTDRGEDKKHHIFPYFFAKALQERNTNLGAIYQYLQRNIPYTSRRLHDRSQDPQIFGNTSQEIIPVP